MLQHSLDEQLEQYRAQWKPNFLGVVVCVTWLIMVIKSGIFLDFVENPKLFAIYFMALFPVVYCVEKAMRELHRFLTWCFHGVFGWLDNFLESDSSDDVALPLIFTTTITVLAVGATVGLFDAAGYLVSILP